MKHLVNMPIKLIVISTSMRNFANHRKLRIDRHVTSSRPNAKLIRKKTFLRKTFLRTISLAKNGKNSPTNFPKYGTLVEYSYKSMSYNMAHIALSDQLYSLCSKIKTDATSRLAESSQFGPPQPEHGHHSIRSIFCL